jgi:hypothetical protein
MHDENSFMAAFGSDSTAVIISIKFINPFSYAKKLSFLVSGCRISYATMLVFNSELISSTIMPEKFRNRGPA